MIQKYTELHSIPLKSGATFARPVQILPERVKWSDPATSVMTDLTKVSVVSVRASTTMDKANAKMIRYGVRMLLVLDDNEQLMGLLTATDILGEKPMRFLQSVGGTHAEILVSDIMSSQSELEVLKSEEVQKAAVGNIVVSLKKAHRQHALVVKEAADGRQSLCGLFSVTQIARQLGAQAQNFELASTFAEIEATLPHA
ncbi:MAG: CBS domain-containing protein [Gallionellales bacterium RIFOXYB12_FULL_54_9]|nr:MAG: CBS domain-containing protein [Gallionellales bacterium RIFOXYB12_FULL_54_9]